MTLRESNPKTFLSLGGRGIEGEGENS